MSEMISPRTSSPPYHIAIIMDGNGRWARRRGLPRSLGHRHGAEALRQAIAGAMEHGVKYLTVYAFSAENWRRSASEIDDLMGLLRRYLKNEIGKLKAENVQFHVIGQRHRLQSDLQALVVEAEARTRDCQGLILTLALSYGSRQEIAAATRHLAQLARAKLLDPTEIDEKTFAKYLMTQNMPDPDLLIRTGGEMRFSNFLLWQVAYTEMVFRNVLWPDFTKQDLMAAIEEYHQRTRRYGALVET